MARVVDACGATTSLAVGTGAYGRGLFTTAAAREGDTLLSVPLRRVLCVTTGGSETFIDQLLRNWSADGERLPPDLEAFVRNKKVEPAPRLAAWLLWARQQSPVWRAADELLPDPSFRVQAATESAAETLAAYTSAVADPALAVSPERWAWALSVIASRTFGADAWTRGERQGILGVFVPVADLLNHGVGPNCQFRLRADAGKFEVFARQGIAAGQEVCISYGEDLANDVLMKRYGFSLGPDNPNGDTTPPPRKRVNWI